MQETAGGEGEGKEIVFQAYYFKYLFGCLVARKLIAADEAALPRHLSEGWLKPKEHHHIHNLSITCLESPSHGLDLDPYCVLEKRTCSPKQGKGLPRVPLPASRKS